MSNLPYIADFRVIIHVWLENNKQHYELMDISVWRNRFLLRNINDSKKIVDTTELIKGVKLCEPLIHNYYVYNEDEYLAKEILQDGHSLHSVVDCDIIEKGMLSNDEGFFEVIGKIYCKFYTDYWGEHDMKTNFNYISVQEVNEDDVILHLKETI